MLVSTSVAYLYYEFAPQPEEESGNIRNVFFGALCKERRLSAIMQEVLLNQFDLLKGHYWCGFHYSSHGIAPSMELMYLELHKSLGFHYVQYKMVIVTPMGPSENCHYIRLFLQPIRVGACTYASHSLRLSRRGRRGRRRANANADTIPLVERDKSRCSI